MTAPEETGTWVLLSKALARVPQDRIKAEQDALIEQIAEGRLRVRYFNWGDPLTSPRTNHREERLPAHFFRWGRPDWLFSAETFGERTIHQIEVFLPDSGGKPAIDHPPKLGRPGSWKRVREEAARRAANGELYDTRIAFGRALSTWLKDKHPEEPQMEPRRIANVIGDLGGVREKRTKVRTKVRL